MSQISATDRRSFLKTGALVAAPLVAMAPVAARAADGSAARLARLDDTRQIEQLQRAFLRRFNGAPPNGSSRPDCGEFLARADAVSLDTGISAIIEDPAQEEVLQFARDGHTASYRRACQIEIARDFDGDTTIEQMARLQGQGSHRRSERRLLESEFARAGTGAWSITSLRIA